jgi:hypothetical protein
MNEFTPRSTLRIVPPTVEAPPIPDYSQATPTELRRAHARELTSLISADLGHIVLVGVAFFNQLYALAHGEDFVFDWDPDVTGLRPDLDEKERVATERLQAIFREQDLRRSVRQQLRDQ